MIMSAKKAVKTQNITMAKPTMPTGLSNSLPYSPSLRLKRIDNPKVTIREIQTGQNCLAISVKIIGQERISMSST
jgi:hypothetical protein